MKRYVQEGTSRYIVESDDGIAPVESDREGCAGCVFVSYEEGVFNACLEHACFAYQFPPDHALNTATRPIVWVRTQ